MDSGGDCPVCGRTMYLHIDGEENIACLSGCYKAIQSNEFIHEVRVGYNEIIYEPTESQKEEDKFNKQVDKLRNIYRKSHPPEEAAMLEALRTNPYDQVTRNQYYDWLQEMGGDDEAAEIISWTTERIKAKEDLIIFGVEVDQSYDQLIAIGHEAIKDPDDYVYFNSTEASYKMSNLEVRRKFWQDWSKVTGIRVGEDVIEHNMFSCSC